MELGESLEQTAQRETEDETGFRMVHLSLLGVFSGPGIRYRYPDGAEVYNVTTAYVTHRPAGHLTLDPAEHTEYAFFDRRQLPET